MELLELYRTRAEVKRPPHHPSDYEKEVWERFEFEETPSQKTAIEEIFEDLARPEPMERLVVGDVGFGKTEVALRAALRVVLNGKQVAILSPTTAESGTKKHSRKNIPRWMSYIYPQLRYQERSPFLFPKSGLFH
jgi:transcription-repair coupling factor (superfamily II helicase)